MKMERNQGNSSDEAGGTEERRVFVWDVAVRLFHWALVVLVVTSLVTGKTGDMDIHQMSGFCILTLVLFRIAWGFAGGRHARFTDFVRGPAAVFAYLHQQVRGTAGRYLGHNPMGGWSVVAMLTLLALQAGTGLFANDDILTEGPLMKFIEKETSDTITWVHFLSSNALMAVIALHLAAIAYYRIKGENLVGPMVTGHKTIDDPGADEKGAEAGPRGNLLVALVLFAAAAGAVTYIVNL